MHAFRKTRTRHGNSLVFHLTSGQPVLRTECLRGHPSPSPSTEAITFSCKSESWLLILSTSIIDPPQGFNSADCLYVDCWSSQRQLPIHPPTDFNFLIFNIRMFCGVDSYIFKEIILKKKTTLRTKYLTWTIRYLIFATLAGPSIRTLTHVISHHVVTCTTVVALVHTQHTVIKVRLSRKNDKC